MFMTSILPRRPVAEMKIPASAQRFAATSQSSDDGALRQAILQVVSIWLNRLSLVSGIASFFASIDSLLFSLASTSTHLGDPETPWSATDKLTTASFAGALIFHVCSAILAFVASFVLVRLQLIDADDQEPRVDMTIPSQRKIVAHDPERLDAQAAQKTDHRPSTSSAADRDASTAEAEGTAKAESTSDPYAAVLARVTVQRTHPLSFLRLPARKSTTPPEKPSTTPDAILNPPIELLERCHTLAVWMSVLGFILGVIGILAYAWVATPLAVSVFSTACLGVCFLAGVIAVW